MNGRDQFSSREPKASGYVSPYCCRSPPFLTSAVAEWCSSAFWFSSNSSWDHVRSSWVGPAWGIVWEIGRMRSHCRQIFTRYLRIFRYGGEGFRILMSNCSFFFRGSYLVMLPVHSSRILRSLLFLFPRQPEDQLKPPWLFSLLFLLSPKTVLFASTELHLLSAGICRFFGSWRSWWKGRLRLMLWRYRLQWEKFESKRLAELFSEEFNAILEQSYFFIFINYSSSYKAYCI